MPTKVKPARMKRAAVPQPSPIEIDWNDTAAAFKAVFRLQPVGVAVITADIGRGPVALTASSVSSVSVNPPMLMVSLSGQSSSTPTIRAAKSLTVHLIDAQELGIAQLAATSNVDRFANRAQWDRSAAGEPYYIDTHRRIRGRIADEMAAGDAYVLLIEVLEVFNDRQAGDAAPLVYYNKNWHVLGDHTKLNPF